MPNFIEIGGVTRKPLVDLTRNDPSVNNKNTTIQLSKLPSIFFKVNRPYPDCIGYVFAVAQWHGV